MRWLGGLALAALASAPAAAQLSTIGSGPQANKNAPVLFQADDVQYDDQLGLTVARGHVEISQGNQVLLADTVSYNQRTDTITASGHVSLLQPTGEVLFADFMELRDSLNNGFATNVRMLFSDRSRLVGNAARRINGNRTELARGVYSPCDLCKDDPTKPPAWQMKAREIVHDRANKLVEFNDVTMELDGWPIFYSPYLSTPDPTVKRASGFLIPSFGSSNTTGLHLSLPYFWVLGPDKDLTLAPRFTSRAGPLLATEYRQRFGNGTLDIIDSLNYSNVGAGNVETVNHQMRGHINATGVWDLDDTYRTGFSLQRVSDQTYLLRFNFPNPPLNAEISHAYLQGFDRRGMTDVDAYMFQPLQPGLGDSTQPIVLPVANRTWISEPDGWGGRWKLNANLMNIVREVGTQTRRVSLGSEWEKTFRDGIGGQYKAFASVRGDIYSVNSLSPLSNPDLPTAYFAQKGLPAAERIGYSFFAPRAFPQVGLQWSYPLVRRGENTTALVEPIVAAFAGPSGGNQHRIPNEDSLNFEFRDSDLFRPDRLSGYDLLDTGQRVDYGLKLGLYNKDGGSYRMLIGQSLRAQTNNFMPPGSGAEQNLSDIVGRVTLSPTSYLDLIYRFRFDKRTLADRTQEVGTSFGPQSLRLGMNFLLIPAQQRLDVVTNPVTGQSILYGRREQLVLTLNSRLTQYWSLNGTETINLSNASNLVNGVPTPQSTSTSLYASLSAVYQDECMAFVGTLSQSGIRNGDVTPGVSVLFSVVFKNLGEIGSTVASISGGP